MLNNKVKPVACRATYLQFVQHPSRQNSKCTTRARTLVHSYARCKSQIIRSGSYIISRVKVNFIIKLHRETNCFSNRKPFTSHAICPSQAHSKHPSVPICQKANPHPPPPTHVKPLSLIKSHKAH